MFVSKIKEAFIQKKPGPRFPAPENDILKEFFRNTASRRIIRTAKHQKIRRRSYILQDGFIGKKSIFAFQRIKNRNSSGAIEGVLVVGKGRNRQQHFFRLKRIYELVDQFCSSVAAKQIFRVSRSKSRSIS